MNYVIIIGLPAMILAIIGIGKLCKLGWELFHRKKRGIKTNIYSHVSMVDIPPNRFPTKVYGIAVDIVGNSNIPYKIKGVELRANKIDFSEKMLNSFSMAEEQSIVQNFIKHSYCSIYMRRIINKKIIINDNENSFKLTRFEKATFFIELNNPIIKRLVRIPDSIDIVVNTTEGDKTFISNTKTWEVIKETYKKHKDKPSKIPSINMSFRTIRDKSSELDHLVGTTNDKPTNIQT